MQTSRGIIVPEEYTINERFGAEKYEITVDSPGFNQPINHFYKNCKVTDFKTIGNLRVLANIVRAKGLADNGDWVNITSPKQEADKKGKDNE